MPTDSCKDGLNNITKARIEKEKQMMKTETEKNISEKTKDVLVKAIQIGKHALVDWGILIDDYNDYKTNYNINHNIMVKNQKQIVEAVDKIIDNLVMNDAEFARFKHKKENIIFPLLVLFCSKSCLRNGIREFDEIINNGNSVEIIEKMLQIDGIKELYHIDGLSDKTEKKVEKFLEKLIT